MKLQETATINILNVESQSIIRGLVLKIFHLQQAVHPAGELFGQIVFKTMGTLTYSGNINTGANSHGIHQMDSVLGSYIAGSPPNERAIASTSLAA